MHGHLQKGRLKKSVCARRLLGLWQAFFFGLWPHLLRSTATPFDSQFSWAHELSHLPEMGHGGGGWQLPSMLTCFPDCPAESSAFFLKIGQRTYSHGYHLLGSSTLTSNWLLRGSRVQSGIIVPHLHYFGTLQNSLTYQYIL